MPGADARDEKFVKSDAALQRRTIRDFGDQWRHFGEDRGYYASLELLQDLLGPLMDVRELSGLRVADVGSGTGRIARMLLEAGAAQVIALEPSQAAEALRESLAPFGARAEVIAAAGEDLPVDRALDAVFSIGVIQFIVDPEPVLRTALRALRPGGKLVLWVYSREGAGAYAAANRALRAVTTRLRHRALVALCTALEPLVSLYVALCRLPLPLPLRSYMRDHLGRLDRSQRRLTLYDQLNPSYAKFYTRAELDELIRRSGFSAPRLHHRHGYSWTAVAEKPA